MPEQKKHEGDWGRDELVYSVGFADGAYWALTHPEDLLQLVVLRSVGDCDTVNDLVARLAGAAALLMGSHGVFEGIEGAVWGEVEAEVRAEAIESIRQLSVYDFVRPDPRRN